jgi:hypothetical protein
MAWERLQQKFGDGVFDVRLVNINESYNVPKLQLGARYVISKVI